MESSWSHNDVFPVIAHAIETLNATDPQYATHDAIVSQLLSDPEALSYIDTARTSEAEDHSREWVAHNMVAWFSQRITVGESPWAKRFERQRVGGKWAYRVTI